MHGHYDADECEGPWGPWARYGTMVLKKSTEDFDGRADRVHCNETPENGMEPQKMPCQEVVEMDLR